MAAAGGLSAGQPIGGPAPDNQALPDGHDGDPQPFRVLGRSVAYQGFTRLEVLDIEQTRASGEIMRMKREIETHGNGASVLAFDPKRRIGVLVRQLRVPVGLSVPRSAYLLETIAGLIDHAGDDAADTARREALEEAGLRIGDLVEVASPFTSPGISCERLSLFLAEIDLDTDRVTAGGGLADEHEDIEVVHLPLARLAGMADAGEILDLKTFALIQSLRLKRPELFV
jgi:nudix-type nucleoside diphosphatase (YffH/AdpP family)